MQLDYLGLISKTSGTTYGLFRTHRNNRWRLSTTESSDSLPGGDRAEKRTISDEQTETDEQRTDEARRSFLKKGALASGALALSGGAIGSAAAQQTTTTKQGGMQALIFSYNYYPGTTAIVEGQLPNPLTQDILNGVQDQGIDDIPNPGQYTGYVVRYRFASQGQTQGSAGQGGIFAFLFSKQSLQKDSAYNFSQQANVLSPELNLLQVQLQQASN